MIACLRLIVEQNLLEHPSLKIEYISFSNFLTAQNYKDDEIINPQNCQKLLISVAVKLGNTRLIDNVVVNLSEDSTHKVNE